MEVKLFVSNLTDSINEQSLQRLFSRAGTVVSIYLLEDGTGRPGGRSAQLTMATEGQAQHAISMFQGFVLAGQPLVVRRGRSPESHAGYQNRLSAFGPAAKGANVKSQRPRPAGGGYQGSLGAFGKGKEAPARPRRRGGSQKS
jgi:RNA recognition motif-containing protein